MTSSVFGVLLSLCRKMLPGMNAPFTHHLMVSDANQPSLYPITSHRQTVIPSIHILCICHPNGCLQWCIAKNGGGYKQTGVAKGLKVPCLFMITEMSIRCQKNPGGWYTPYTRVYPPIHHWLSPKHPIHITQMFDTKIFTHHSIHQFISPGLVAV